MEGVVCPEHQDSADCLGDLASATLPPDEQNGGPGEQQRVDWLTRAIWNSVIEGENGEDDITMMYWEDSDGNKGPEGEFPDLESTVVIPPGMRIHHYTTPCFTYS